jgi:hypothetical protein
MPKIINVEVQQPDKPETRRVIGKSPQYGLTPFQVAEEHGIKNLIAGKIVSRGKQNARWLLVSPDA